MWSARPLVHDRLDPIVGALALVSKGFRPGHFGAELGVVELRDEPFLCNGASLAEREPNDDPVDLGDHRDRLVGLDRSHRLEPVRDRLLDHDGDLDRHRRQLEPATPTRASRALAAAGEGRDEDQPYGPGGAGGTSPSLRWNDHAIGLPIMVSAEAAPPT